MSKLFVELSGGELVGDKKAHCALPDEDASDRLRRTMSPSALRVELVSAYSGDRKMTEAESAQMRLLEHNRGDVFYSDLFYSISHHYFAPDISKALWNKVLKHKHLMSECLGRNVRITVATLDYLSNITNSLETPTLISEPYVSEMAALSMVDGMTGLYNHSSCYELLELELRKYRRYSIGFSLILLDIDDFKSINDRWGHQEGDRTLIALAKMLREQTRDTDICCRYGGEEFIVLLPFTNDAKEACEIAERIRVGATSIRFNGQEVTISAGVALCDKTISTPQVLIENADRALYQAKASGKNQIVLSVVQ